ncbi:MAG: FKBP-type peptidyl-prolyl cis-trans isomerase [Planctomycetota bacterium]
MSHVPRLLCVAVLLVSVCSCTEPYDPVPPTVNPVNPTNKAYPSEPGPIDDDAPEEMTLLDSGLQYRILRKSDGRKPTAADSVFAHYAGWLEDGTQFDSSYDRGSPSQFSLSGVISGWTQGLQLIGEGGMIELKIPSNLAYGPAGRPGIPPNATLLFRVELFEVR